MPTLIRFVVVLVVLAALAFGAMLALVMTVNPQPKDVVIRIPASDLVPNPDNGQIVRREIDTTRPPTPAPAVPDAPAPSGGVVTDLPSGVATPGAGPALPPPATDDSSPDVQTLAPGNE